MIGPNRGKMIERHAVISPDGSVYGYGENAEHAQECARLLNDGHAPHYAIDAND